MSHWKELLKNKRDLLLAAAGGGVLTALVLTAVLVPIVGSVRDSVSEFSISLPEREQVPVSVSAETEERETVKLSEYGGYPYYGEEYGHLTISGTAVDCGLYYGDSEVEFSGGAGTYMGACIPGEGGSILIGGHTGTYFRDFESAALGADICVETRWGTYHYEITDMQVIRYDDPDAYDLEADEENILLYTCYPFGQIAVTDYRYMIYGSFVSGPEIAEETP